MQQQTERGRGHAHQMAAHCFIFCEQLVGHALRRVIEIATDDDW